MRIENAKADLEAAILPICQKFFDSTGIKIDNISVYSDDITNLDNEYPVIHYSFIEVNIKY